MSENSANQIQRFVDNILSVKTFADHQDHINFARNKRTLQVIGAIPADGQEAENKPRCMSAQAPVEERSSKRVGSFFCHRLMFSAITGTIISGICRSFLN
jgi:hypothetical protein